MQLDFLLLQAITAEHSARTGHKPDKWRERKPYMISCDVCLNLCDAWKQFENWEAQEQMEILRQEQRL